MFETVLIVILILLALGLCIYLGYKAIVYQFEGVVVLAIAISISLLVIGNTLIHDIEISNIKNNQYNYQIQYNDTIYYTNDYVLSNGGIEFEAEEGHFIFPVEEQEFKIKKTKKGDQ